MTELSKESEHEVQNRVWMIVYSGPRCYIGKAINNDLNKQQLAEHMEKAGFISLFPAFEYISQIVRDNQSGKIGRAPLCLPFDITSGPVPVTVRIDSFVFLEELQEQDVQGYKDFIRDGYRFFEEARAKKAGIILPR